MKQNLLSVLKIEKRMALSSCVLALATSTAAYAQNFENQSAYSQTASGANSFGPSTANQRQYSEQADASGGAGTTTLIPGVLPRISNSAGRTSQEPAKSKGMTRAGNNAIGRSILGRKITRGPSEFQRYVYEATGASLQVFGSDLFENPPDAFAPIGSAQINPDYIVGTGDELQIRGWGMVDIDITAQVDRNGSINIPRVGTVHVAGVKYRDLQGHLKKAIGRVFSGFELTATVSQTRAVQVYVVGHAAQPGTYTLNAMSTLLNALFASGGPNGTGSMRNIQVKRGDATVTTFDLYDMLVKGDKSRDIALQDGDVIHIPEVGPLVALTGNVKKPGIFEFKSNDSTADVLVWAGGFESSAELKEIIVEKNVNNRFEAIANLKAENGSAKETLNRIPLQPAEILRVFAPGAVPIEAQISNEYVRVSGEVKQAGVFQIRKGETLREFIARLGGVNENGYLYAMQLNRESVRRTQQLKLDEVANRYERDVEASAKHRLSGVTDPQNLAAITTEIERQRQLAQKLRSVKAQGRIALELENGDAALKNLPDITLQNGDSIHVPRTPGTIDVLGSVFQPSTFMYKPHRTVNDYITMAGGGTISADTSEIYLLRADGTAASGKTSGWFSGIGGVQLNAGDTIVVPERVERTTWTQALKEWTSILYQFGLGAAGLKVLKD